MSDQFDQLCRLAALQVPRRQLFKLAIAIMAGGGIALVPARRARAGVLKGARCNRGVEAIDNFHRDQCLESEVLCHDATAGHGQFCCPAATHVCNSSFYCCPKERPVGCVRLDGAACCRPNETCCYPIGLDKPPGCCPAGFPVDCEDDSCCPAGTVCFGGFLCCPAERVCKDGARKRCCPDDRPACVGGRCCPEGTTVVCNGVCCKPGQVCRKGSCREPEQPVP